MDLSELWRWVRHERSHHEDVEEDLHHQVGMAHREWVTAQMTFQSVSDPTLVDHAIHSINAAEQRYTHLLRKLREHRGRTGQE